MTITAKTGWKRPREGKLYAVSISRGGLYRPWEWVILIGPGRFEFDGRCWTKAQARREVEEMLRPFKAMGFEEMEWGLAWR